MLLASVVGCGNSRWPIWTRLPVLLILSEEFIPSAQMFQESCLSTLCMQCSTVELIWKLTPTKAVMYYSFSICIIHITMYYIIMYCDHNGDSCLELVSWVRKYERHMSVTTIAAAKSSSERKCELSPKISLVQQELQELVRCFQESGIRKFCLEVYFFSLNLPHFLTQLKCQLEVSLRFASKVIFA